MPAIKIAIFDDHPIIASGIIGYLAQYPEQINTFFAAHTRPDLLANISAHPPDVLILDVVAPDVNGLDLFVEVIKTFPKVKIIAYTTLKSPILVENLLLTGVKGFVNKSQPLDELLDAIEEVYNGYISVPQKYKYLTARFRETQNTTLTPREIEIIVLIAHEATTQQIAEQLGVSTKTIENHKANIFHKLGVKNAAGLILSATRLGYIT